MTIASCASPNKWGQFDDRGSIFKLVWMIRNEWKMHARYFVSNWFDIVRAKRIFKWVPIGVCRLVIYI